MAHLLYRLEAERCRLQATAYLGRPEAPFLLRIARAFEQLADEDQTSDRAPFRTGNELSRPTPTAADF